MLRFVSRLGQPLAASYVIFIRRDRNSSCRDWIAQWAIDTIGNEAIVPQLSWYHSCVLHCFSIRPVMGRCHRWLKLRLVTICGARVRQGFRRISMIFCTMAGMLGRVSFKLASAIFRFGRGCLTCARSFSTSSMPGHNPKCCLPIVPVS